MAESNSAERSKGRRLPSGFDATDACRNPETAGTEAPLLQLTTAPPESAVEPVTEILHGVPITDPYRWLEKSGLHADREWLAATGEYARAYLDAIPGPRRICEGFAIFWMSRPTTPSSESVKDTFFRKRTRGQEQPCIYLRERPNGEDQLLLDPANRGTGNHTALKPLQLSQDGRVLLYEVKEGGERTGTFELFDIKEQKKLPDSLPRGYLRGFLVCSGRAKFLLRPRGLDAERPYYRAAFHHVVGASFDDDREIFCAGEDAKLRLHIIPGEKCIGFLVVRHYEKAYTDFYLRSCDNDGPAYLLIEMPNTSSDRYSRRTES